MRSISMSMRSPPQKERLSSKGKVVHRQDTARLAANEDIRRRYLAM
jgi:hypothetical protein